MPYLDPSTHDDRIAITINLAALSSGGQGFRPLVIGTDLDIGGTGARTTSYTSTTAVDTDLADGNISTFVAAAVKEMLGQSPRPELVRVGNWDSAGEETIAECIDAILAETTDFYAICMETRTAADLVALGAKLTSLAADGAKFIAVLQNSDADWKTTGIPAAFSDLEEHERVAMVVHGTAAAPRAEGWAANRLARSPDVASVPWHGPVREVYSFTADTVTQAQKEFIRANNANIALPFGTIYRAYFDPGVTLAGRPVDQIVSADWFEVRLREAMADLIATMSANGEKLGVNADGQNRLTAVFNKVAAQGVGARHFEAGQVVITPETITDADRAANRLRFTSGAQHVVAARAVDLTINLSTSPVVE